MNEFPFNKTKVLIISHKSIEGLPDELRNYLLQKKVRSLLYIMHPLLYDKESFSKTSKFEYYKNGELSVKKQAVHWRLPEFILYLKDLIYTLIWVLNSGEKFDLCIGVNDLNAFTGVLLRKLGRVKKMVYYNIDYVPKRFNNNFLNSLYHWFDRYSCYNTDLNWIGTERTNKARIENGLEKHKMAKTIIVPDGNYSLRIKKRKIGEIKLNRLVYLGYVLKKQGLDLVIHSLPQIRKKIKNIELIIIGNGEYIPTLKRIIQKLKIERHVKFLGYVDDRKAEKILTQSAIGVATYVPDKESFTYYSEAGKPKYYLGCGLPVVITKVPAIAFEIDKKKAGIAINYNVKDFVGAIFKILDKKNYSIYKKNATELGAEFDWSIIFKSAFLKTLNSS